MMFINGYLPYGMGFFYFFGKEIVLRLLTFFWREFFFSKRASLVNHQSLIFCVNFTNFKGYNSSWKRKLIKDDFSDQSDCLPLDFLVLKVTSQFLLLKVSLLISHILAARKEDSFLFAHTNFDYKVNQFWGKKCPTRLYYAAFFFCQSIFCHRRRSSIFSRKSKFYTYFILTTSLKIKVAFLC